jgi:pimeloyl-ACP methyl ester carboxylesterase
MKAQTFHPFRSEKAQKQYLDLYDKKAEMWPIPSETKMINTSFGQTFVRISGPDDASPLILLPGANGNSLSWLPNIKALSTYYKTYAIDNICDYGRSIYSHQIKSLDDLIKWLDELFNGLKLKEKINLMGLSYGGWQTAQYALCFPQRINKIVLLAPASTVLPLSIKFRLHGFLCIFPFQYFTKKFTLWMFEDLIKKSETIRRSTEKSVKDLFLAKKCFKPIRFVNPTVLKDEQLQDIKVPTLYLVGENDKIYSPQKAIERLNKIAPQIKTEIIPNAGHDLTISQAEIVNSKILEFLQS